MEEVNPFRRSVDSKRVHISLVGTGGGCEFPVVAKTRCGCVKIGECGKLLHGKRFPLILKWAVCRSYVRLAILYRSEAWCLSKSKIGML